MRARQFILLPLLVSLVSLQAQPSVDGSIAGSTLRYNGTPVSAEILAYRLKTASGLIVPHLECAAHSDIEGAFRCETVPVGAYILVISHERSGGSSFSGPVQTDKSGHNEQVAADRVLSSIATYPIVPKDNLSAALTINAGETRYVAIAVEDAPKTILKAQPLGPGMAAEQITLFMDWDSFRIPMNMEPSLDRDGMLAWSGLSPGTYETVEGWSLNDHAHQTNRTWEVSEQTFSERSSDSNGTITVTGHVAYKNTAGMEDTRLVLTRSNGFHTQTYMSPVDASGTFVISDLASGTYVISFDTKNGLDIESLTVGGRVLDPSVVVALSGDQSFDIVARKATRTISGAVSEAKTGLIPLVVISNPRAGVSITADVGQDGSFRTKTLAPGTYRIYCFQDATKAPYADIFYLGTHTTGSVEANIDNGNAQNVVPTCRATEF